MSEHQPTTPGTERPPTGRFDARSLYLYTVCLVCAVVALVATVQVLRNIVELIWTDPQVGSWATAADERRVAQRAAQRGNALDLVTAAVLLAVSVPAWRFHWTRAQADRRR